MNDFDYENMQKKRLARNSKYKKNGSKSRKCTLPSDHLTPAQKRALNGEVQTFNLSKPMTRAQFLAAPFDLQKEYIERLRERFKASDQMIGEMFGVSSQAVTADRARLGIRAEAGVLLRATKTERETFREWWNPPAAWEHTGFGEPIRLTAADIEQIPDQPVITPAIVEKLDKLEQEKKPKGPDSMILGGSFRLSGTAGAMAEQIAYLFANDPRRGSFVLTFEFEGGDQA